MGEQTSTIETDTICQNVYNRPTKKYTHPDIILSHHFLGKSISSLQKSILDSDLITGVPSLLQPRLPFKVLKAFCSNKGSAFQSYGLATITPWGTIHPGVLDCPCPNPKRVPLTPLQIKNQLFSPTQRKKRDTAAALVATLFLQATSGEMRQATSQADLVSDILQSLPSVTHMSTLDLFPNLCADTGNKFYFAFSLHCPSQCLMTKECPDEQDGTFVPRSK